MDPLSTAASGIAVISLAVQLAGSVQNIHRFLRGISDAPKELERLVELLDQLHCILDGIRALYPKQNQQNCIPDMHPSVMRALQTCQSKLEQLENQVDKAKIHLKRSNKVLKTWASLKLTLKKKDLDEFESRLEKAMIRLQMALTMNIAHVQLNHIRNASVLVSEASSLRCSPGSATTATQSSDVYKVSIPQGRAETMKPSRTSVAMRCSQRQVVVVDYRHRMFSGTFLYRTTSTYRSLWPTSTTRSDSEPDARETVLSFVSSFFSRYIELRIKNDCGSISATLTTYSVVNYESPLYQACRRGDVEALRSILSGQGLSPFVVDEYGNTLLHIAAGWKRAEVCRFLLDSGLDPNYVDWSGRVPLTTIYDEGFVLRHLSQAEQIAAYSDTVKAIVSYGQTDLTAINVHEYAIWICGCRPEAFELVLNQDQVEDYFRNLEDREISNLLASVLTRFGVDEIWRPIVWRFLGMRLDLHMAEYKTNPGSLLDFLFLKCESPRDSRDVANDWLVVLSYLGVNIHDYLQMEIRLHPGCPPLTRDQYREDSLCKRQLIFSLEGTPSVCWDWWIDPDEPASLLCDEFKVVAHRFRFGLGYENGDQWPYVCPEWLLGEQLGPETMFGRHLYPDSLSTKRRKIFRQAKERFARRARKKAAKQHKAMGLDGSFRMPGAWIQ